MGEATSQKKVKQNASQRSRRSADKRKTSAGKRSEPRGGVKTPKPGIAKQRTGKESASSKSTAGEKLWKLVGQVCGLMSDAWAGCIWLVKTDVKGVEAGWVFNRSYSVPGT